jgi:menaquinone-dependent protoporphyrinogen oxidase
MGKPENLDDLMARTGARDHEVFVGRLDRDELSMSERLISRVVKSPEGDFRDWDAIRSWARSIAESLS